MEQLTNIIFMLSPFWLEVTFVAIQFSHCDFPCLVQQAWVFQDLVLLLAFTLVSYPSSSFLPISLLSLHILDLLSIKMAFSGLASFASCDVSCEKVRVQKGDVVFVVTEYQRNKCTGPALVLARGDLTPTMTFRGSFITAKSKDYGDHLTSLGRFIEFKFGTTQDDLSKEDDFEWIAGTHVVICWQP